MCTSKTKHTTKKSGRHQTPKKTPRLYPSPNTPKKDPTREGNLTIPIKPGDMMGNKVEKTEDEENRGRREGAQEKGPIGKENGGILKRKKWINKNEKRPRAG